MHSLKCAVVNINSAFGEISNIEIALAIDQCAGDAGVTGPVFGPRPTVTAWVEGAASPCPMATFGFQPAMVPSIVQNRKFAAMPPVNKKSVWLLLAIVPLGEPMGVDLFVGSAGGMVTIRGFLIPAPL
jgi:hypothetical protein